MRTVILVALFATKFQMGMLGIHTRTGFVRTQYIANSNVSFYNVPSPQSQIHQRRHDASLNWSRLIVNYIVLSANTTDYTVPRITTKYGKSTFCFAAWILCLKFSLSSRERLIVLRFLNVV